MKQIEAFERMVNGEITEGINDTVFWAYKRSKLADNKTLNFYDIIWEKDIEDIVKTLRNHEVEEITISSGFSGMNGVIWEFEKLGCKLVGMIEVKTSYPDIITGERRKEPAFLIKL